MAAASVADSGPGDADEPLSDENARIPIDEEDDALEGPPIPPRREIQLAEAEQFALLELNAIKRRGSPPHPRVGLVDTRPASADGASGAATPRRPDPTAEGPGSPLESPPRFYRRASLPGVSQLPPSLPIFPVPTPDATAPSPPLSSSLPASFCFPAAPASATPVQALYPLPFPVLSPPLGPGAWTAPPSPYPQPYAYPPVSPPLCGYPQPPSPAARPQHPWSTSALPLPAGALPPPLALPQPAVRSRRGPGARQRRPWREGPPAAWPTSGWGAAPPQGPPGYSLPQAPGGY